MTRFEPTSRRGFIATGLLATAGSGLPDARARAAAARPKGAGREKKTSAVEDLMREHGVLRRALLVYAELVPRVRSGAHFDAKPLADAARLFRNFGEDYHKRKLEEAHIFPLIRNTRGPASAYADVLTAQHNRGREITDYIISETKAGSVPDSRREPLSRALEQFVLMYQNHTAREDTIVFPAWKDALSQAQIDELGEQFEDIEHKQFGKDGFEDAVRRIGRVEEAYGLSDISRFTASAPPKV